MFEDSMVAQGSGARPHAQVHLLSPTDKCKVCNEPAAKHVHYGAMTCFSCRAFFRRSIQNKTSSTYVCRRAKSCEINLKTRKNCQFCRYSRCLAVGMKPTWVLSEEERQRRFRKNREKQEAGQVAGGGGRKTARSRGNSLNELTGDFELLEGTSLSDTLPGLLLLEQAAEARESVPVILEKQQQNVVVKNELCADRQGDQGLEQQQGHNNYFGILPRGEPSKTQSTSFFVKAEPKPVFSHNPYIGEVQQKAPPSAAVPQRVETGQTHQQQLLYVTSASQFPSSTRQQAPAAAQQSYMPRLSQPQRMPPPPRPAFLSSTPSVIVQAGSVARSFDYQPSGLDFSANFPPEVGSFATVGAVETELVSSGQRFSSNHQEFPVTPSLSQEDYERQLEDGLEYVDSVYSDSEDDEEPDEERKRRAAEMRERMLMEPEIKFTQEEELQLDKLVKQHNERYRSVNFGEELIKEMIMCSMFGIPVSTSAAISGYRLSVERITRIAHNLDSFTDLPKQDQNALLQENADLLVSLRGAIFFDSKKKGVDQVLISMGIDDMKTIKTMFTPLLKENSMKHIDYKTFNSIQAIANPATEARYNYLQCKVADSIPDDACIIFITFSILFSTDFCLLSDRSLVERTQEVFTRLLQRYLYSQKPRHTACALLSSVLSSVSYIREMADIKKSRAINQNVKVPS